MITDKRIMNRIGLFSFFAGAGFLDLGFERTQGFHTIFVNEYHKPFMDIYKLNIPDPEFGFSTEDICEFMAPSNSKIILENIQSAKKKFDLIGFIGGPPCPDFSIGGKNKGVSGENGKLSRTFIELIIQNQPDFFLFENVKGLYRTKKHRTFFEEIKVSLISNGYLITEKLINAIEFGVPQDRERIILIGFNQNTLKDKGLDISNRIISKEFTWDLKTIFNKEEIFSLEFQIDSNRTMPLNVEKRLTVQYWFDKNDVLNHPNSTHHFQPRAGLPKFQTISEGDDLKKSYKRLHRWRYSPTAAYGNNEVHLHPYKARRISAAEALAIQSLPKEFYIPEYISLSNMFKTIGNGVPYLAAKGLAESTINFLNKNLTHQPAYAKAYGEQSGSLH